MNKRNMLTTISSLLIIMTSNVYAQMPSMDMSKFNMPSMEDFKKPEINGNMNNDWDIKFKEFQNGFGTGSFSGFGDMKMDTSAFDAQLQAFGIINNSLGANSQSSSLEELMKAKYGDKLPKDELKMPTLPNGATFGGLTNNINSNANNVSNSFINSDEFQKIKSVIDTSKVFEISRTPLPSINSNSQGSKMTTTLGKKSDNSESVGSYYDRINIDSIVNTDILSRNKKVYNATKKAYLPKSNFKLSDYKELESRVNKKNK